MALSGTASGQMRAGWWWLRLQWLEAINRWRVRPLRRTLALLLWVVPAIVVPAVLAMGGQRRADAALDWLLSLDMPMALVMAAQAGAAILSLAARVDTESWINPTSSRGLAGRALFLTRLLAAVRWPAGLLLAAVLLSVGSRDAAERVVELAVISCFAVTGGAALAWLVSGTARADRRPAPAAAARGHGLAALSWVPLRETRHRLNLRRLALLAVPVLLGAPMSATGQQVLRVLAAWLPLLYLINWVRQAGAACHTLQHWMPRMHLAPLRLYWWVWRHVICAALLCVAALWLGWRLSAPQGAAAAR